MTVIRRFEDLVPWQKARELARIVYAITKREPFARDPLASTLRKAVVTITSYIAGGFEARGTRHSRRRLRVALTTCAGLRIQVSTAYKRGDIAPMEYEELMHRITELRYMIDSLQDTLGYL
jgi:four helix bundle protein